MKISKYIAFITIFAVAFSGLLLTAMTAKAEVVVGPSAVGSNGDEGSTLPGGNGGSNVDTNEPTLPNPSGSNGDEIGTTGGGTTPPVDNAPATPGGSSGFVGSNGGGGSVLSLGSLLNSPSPLIASTCPFMTDYVITGAVNDSVNVSKLQTFLRVLGGSPNLAITGAYDADTIAAVKAFQTANLSDIMGPWGATQASGQVYITTLKKINQITCSTNLTLSQTDLDIINAYKAKVVEGGISANSGATISAGSVNISIPPISSSTEVGSGIGTGTTIVGQANRPGGSSLVANVFGAVGHAFSATFSWIGGFFSRK